LALFEVGIVIVMLCEIILFLEELFLNGFTPCTPKARRTLPLQIY